MKKIVLCLTLAILLISPLSSKVSADEYDFNYTVTLQPNGKFESNYNETEVRNQLKTMEPGDKAQINFHLENQFSESVDWYMLNDTLDYFEKDSYGRDTVSGGNYTYKLSYSGNGESKDIYNSDNVGGDNKGLEYATNALDGNNDNIPAIKLDTFNKGNTADLSMYFELDGETQRNNYQDVLGKLTVRFAVETGVPEKKENEPKEETVVKEEKVTVKQKRTVYLPYTGDDSHLATFVLIELILLDALLVVAFAYIAYKRRQEAR